MVYTFYTDGSTRANGTNNAVGAWAWAQIKDDEVVNCLCAAEYDTTNQRMELTAMINACGYAKLLIMNHDFDTVILYTDSAYIVNCMKQRWYERWLTNGWVNSKKQPVANRDLWEQLIPYFTHPNYEIRKTTGHADDKWNNYVDGLAQSASKIAKETKDAFNNNPNL